MDKELMKVIQGFLLLFLIVGTATACLWDSDTLTDEIAVSAGADRFDLIIGQFAHHGEAYYKSRITRLSWKLRAGKADDTERNDLAVAYIRVGEFDEAEALLKEKLEAKPRDYTSLSNMGVLEKKRGNFSEAAKWIEKALVVKPEGHMGLGDWYLKMLRFRAVGKANPGVVPLGDFLGRAYADSFKPNLGGDGVQRRGVSREGKLLMNLLRNDQTFADGFAAMGDHLANGGDLHLAFLAYSRAIELGHPNVSEMKRRRRALLKHREMVENKRFKGNSKRMAWWEAEVAAARKTIAGGASWLKLFQGAEAELVKVKADAVRFTDVEKALGRMGVPKTRP